MQFSQGLDAGFKALLIYIGIVFLWLMVLEGFFGSPATLVLLMNIAAVTAGLAFFFYRRRVCRAERATAEAEVAAILGGVR